MAADTSRVADILARLTLDILLLCERHGEERARRQAAYKLASAGPVDEAKLILQMENTLAAFKAERASLDELVELVEAGLNKVRSDADAGGRGRGAGS